MGHQHFPRRPLPLLTALALVAVLGCQREAGDAGAQAQVAPAARATTEQPAQATAPQQRTRAQRRMEATADVIRGTIMRVDAAAAVTPGPRLADYLVRAGTEQPLQPEALEDLVSLTRTESGFDDNIQRRCMPGAGVGIKLFRKGAATEIETDLVLDFGCDRLLIADAGSAPAFDSFFDPSRAGFLAFVRRALPQDPELRKLR
jgi:hypothetical protein